MEGVVLNGLSSKRGVGLAEQLVVNTDAVVGKSLSVTVVDAFAYLQELKIILNCLFILFDVVV